MKNRYGKGTIARQRKAASVKLQLFPSLRNMAAVKRGKAAAKQDLIALLAAIAEAAAGR